MRSATRRRARVFTAGCLCVVLAAFLLRAAWIKLAGGGYLLYLAGVHFFGSARSESKGTDRKKGGTAVAEALDRVGLAGREKERIHHLSGGEQQRVALARLMVQRPVLVLADEPTGALDDDNSTVVIDILREMSEAGCAVVIATHDAGVRDRCDAVFAVHESSLVRSPAAAGATG